METFNEKKNKLLLESKDIVKDYNDFVKLNFDKNVINRKYDNNDEDHCASYAKYFLYFANDIKTQSKSEDHSDGEIIRSIKTDYHNLDDPEMIRKVVLARVKYIEGMNAILREIVNHNSDLLGLNSKQIEEIISNLNNDKTNYAMATIKEKIFTNKDKFVKDNDRILDLRPLGRGVMICADDDPDYNFKTPENILLGIQSCMTYDLTINSHGSSISTLRNNDNDISEKDYETSKKILCKYIQNKLINFLNNKGEEYIDKEILEDYDNDIERIKKAFIRTKSKRMADDILDIYINSVKNYTKFEDKLEHYFGRISTNNIFVFKAHKEIYKIMSPIFSDDNKYAKTITKYNKQKVGFKDKISWTISPIKYLDGKSYSDIKTLLKVAKQD